MLSLKAAPTEPEAVSKEIGYDCNNKLKVYVSVLLETSANVQTHMNKQSHLEKSTLEKR